MAVAHPGLFITKTLRPLSTQTFDQRESTGAVKNFGLQARMYQQLMKKFEKEM